MIKKVVEQMTMQDYQSTKKELVDLRKALEGLHDIKVNEHITVWDRVKLAERYVSNRIKELSNLAEAYEHRTFNDVLKRNQDTEKPLKMIDRSRCLEE